MTWHLNKRNEPAECRAASPESCPRAQRDETGKIINHFDSEAEAGRYGEKIVAEALAADNAAGSPTRPGGNALSKSAGDAMIATASGGASASAATARTEAMAALAAAGVTGIDESALEDEDVTVLASAYATEEVMLVKNPRNGKWSVCRTKERFDAATPEDRTVRTRLQIDLSDDVSRSAVTDGNAKKRVAWLQAVSRQRELRESMDMSEYVAPVSVPVPADSGDVAALRRLTDDETIDGMIRSNPDVPPSEFRRAAKFYSTMMDGGMPENVVGLCEGSYLEGFDADELQHRGGLYMQTGLGAYVTPTERNAESIAAAVGVDAVVLDPLAGRRWSGKMLRSRGVRVIMSDDKSWSTASNDAVEDLDAIDSVRKHAAACTHVLISWAPGDGVSRDAGGGSAIDWKIIKETMAVNPSAKIVMIAQPYNGPEMHGDLGSMQNLVGSRKARSILDDSHRPAETADWKITSVPYEDAHHMTACWLVDPTPHWKQAAVDEGGK